MSVASDGSVLWWDIRKLAEPVETLSLAEKGSDKVLGAVSLEYSPQAGPTKFLLGTEQGLIISGNRKAKTPADRIGTSYTGPHVSTPSRRLSRLGLSASDLESYLLPLPSSKISEG